MSHITRDINKVTGTVIGLSGKLILYALVILLLAEGITRGYAFGHSLFYESSVEQAPGRDITVTIPDGQKDSDTIHKLKKDGLIDNELAMRIQMKFYDYEIQPGTYTLNTSMSSKKMLQILNEKTEEEGDKTSGWTRTGSPSISIPWIRGMARSVTGSRKTHGRAVYPLSGRKRQVFCRPWWRQNSRSTFWRLEQP